MYLTYFLWEKTQLHDSSGFSPDSILEETSGIDFYVKRIKDTTKKSFNKKSSPFRLLFYKLYCFNFFQKSSNQFLHLRRLHELAEL